MPVTVTKPTITHVESLKMLRCLDHHILSAKVDYQLSGELSGSGPRNHLLQGGIFERHHTGGGFIQNTVRASKEVCIYPEAVVYGNMNLEGNVTVYNGSIVGSVDERRRFKIRGNVIIGRDCWIENTNLIGRIIINNNLLVTDTFLVRKGFHRYLPDTPLYSIIEQDEIGAIFWEFSSERETRLRLNHQRVEIIMRNGLPERLLYSPTFCRGYMFSGSSERVLSGDSTCYLPYIPSKDPGTHRDCSYPLCNCLR
jgi:hypothetical protein